VTTPSPLDAPVHLGDLIDAEALRQLCRTLGDLYGIGLKIFDEGGTKLSDVRVATADHCGYLFSVHSTQKLCTALVNRLRACELPHDGSVAQIECFSGLRYKVVPLLHDGALLGRVIFGPYRPAERNEPAPSLAEHVAGGLELAKLDTYWRRVPVANEPAVAKVLEHVRQVLALIIHNSFKVHLTSRTHLASITTAFSDLQRASDSLNDANGRLADFERVKTNFIAMVSHELRTPLTSIIGYSEMLLEGMAGPINTEQRDYVQVILDKGENLLGLISHVLDLARIESGNVIINKQLSDPRAIISRAIADVTAHAKRRQLQLSVTVSDGIKSIMVDADKIHRVLMNLLGNAIKFTAPGGRIVLTADVCEDMPTGETRYDPFEPERNRFLRLRVTDTGIGIPRDKLERVFDAFFQVDSSSTREFGGSGLGLAITRNFVNAHKGRVSVESEPGEGSTFTVKLPYEPNLPVGAAGVDGLTTSGH